MKFSLRCRNLLLQVCTIGSFSIAFLSVQAGAAEAPKDVSRMISDMRPSIRLATVVIFPPNIETVAGLNTEELRRVGCSYRVISKDDIESLMNIIDGAHIVEAPPFFRGGKTGISARLGIFLTANDNTTTNLIFTGRTDIQRPEFGWLNDDLSVSAKNEQFATELRAWTVARNPLPNEHCRRRLLNPSAH